MKKLLFVVIAAMCFSCGSKKNDEKKGTEEVVKKTEAVQDHKCTGDCESHAKTEKTEGHECTGNCESHSKDAKAQVHKCDHDCKTCPTEDCKARKEAYQGAKNAEASVAVEKEHDCAHCGSCGH